MAETEDLENRQREARRGRGLSFKAQPAEREKVSANTGLSTCQHRLLVFCIQAACEGAPLMVRGFLGFSIGRVLRDLLLILTQVNCSVQFGLLARGEDREPRRR